MILGLRRHFAIAVACLACVGSGTAGAVQGAIVGTVTYRERIALPPNAIVEVKLVDDTIADTVAQVIAETRVQTGGQVPIPFRLEFDPSRITAGRSYALRARILVDDRLWFLTTTRHAVSADGPKGTDIVVQRAPAEPDGNVGSALVGHWLAKSIRGSAAVDQIQSVLRIGSDGRVGGHGGCNTFTGEAGITGDRFTFAAMARTMMACPPAIMDQENKFIAALADVRSWRADGDGRKLELLDADGKVIVLLAPM